MSKVTSMTPGGALDLDARDPNNLNEHLQVISHANGLIENLFQEHEMMGMTSQQNYMKMMMMVMIILW